MSATASILKPLPIDILKPEIQLRIDEEVREGLLKMKQVLEDKIESEAMALCSGDRFLGDGKLCGMIARTIAVHKTDCNCVPCYYGTHLQDAGSTPVGVDRLGYLAAIFGCDRFEPRMLTDSIENLMLLLEQQHARETGRLGRRCQDHARLARRCQDYKMMMLKLKGFVQNGCMAHIFKIQEEVLALHVVIRGLETRISAEECVMLRTAETAHKQMLRTAEAELLSSLLRSPSRRREYLIKKHETLGDEAYRAYVKSGYIE